MQNVHVYIDTPACTHMCMHMHTHTYTGTHTYIHMCAHTYAYTLAHTYAYTCTHIRKHMHSCTHIHICTQYIAIVQKPFKFDATIQVCVWFLKLDKYRPYLIIVHSA